MLHNSPELGIRDAVPMSAEERIALHEQVKRQLATMRKKTQESGMEKSKAQDSGKAKSKTVYKSNKSKCKITRTSTCTTLAKDSRCFRDEVAKKLHEKVKVISASASASSTTTTKVKDIRFMRVQDDMDDADGDAGNVDEAELAWDTFSADTGANMHSAFDLFFDYETLRQNMGDEAELSAATFDAHRRQPVTVSETTWGRNDKLTPTHPSTSTSETMSTRGRKMQKRKRRNAVLGKSVLYAEVPEYLADADEQDGNVDSEEELPLYRSVRIWKNNEESAVKRFRSTDSITSSTASEQFCNNNNNYSRRGSVTVITIAVPEVDFSYAFSDSESETDGEDIEDPVEDNDEDEHEEDDDKDKIKNVNEKESTVIIGDFVIPLNSIVTKFSLPTRLSEDEHEPEK
jgi:hypothetical protein